MNQAEIISQTNEFIRKKFANVEGGHDWYHLDNVRKLALRIGREEGADLFICELGALLHDIADWKYYNGDMTVGPRAARKFLLSINANEETMNRVAHIVEHISYKGAGVENKMESLEGKCVQDADRLEAIGAIGIARCFAYGGSKGRKIYDPEGDKKMHQTFEESSKGSDSSIHHFYEKLLLIKDRLNTESGRKLAEGRHQFLEMFLEEFYEEWNGER